MDKDRATQLRTFPVLQREGLGLIDTGARDGIQPLFHEIAPLLCVVGFEPDAEECERLTRAVTEGRYMTETYLPYALGATDGPALLHLCRSRGTSSLYPPHRALLNRFPDADRFDVIETRAIPVKSLDRLLVETTHAFPPSIDFLKLDTQGSELDVLRGAQETLQRYVIGVQVEVEFSRLYESQPLFRDVDAFLAERGFTLFKLRRAGWVRQGYRTWPHLSAGQVMFADALYLRDPLDPEVVGAYHWSAHQAEALLVVAVLYDLCDFALELLDDARFAALVDVGSVQRYLQWRQLVLERSGWSSGWWSLAGHVLRTCLRGSSGLRRLEAWHRRRWWHRADSDLDFYTVVLGER